MRMASWALAAMLAAPMAQAQQAADRSPEEEAQMRLDARQAVEDALAEMATEQAAAEALAATSVWHAIGYFRKYGNQPGVRWLDLFEAASGMWKVDLRTVQPNGSLRSVWVETPTKDGPAAYYRQQMFLDCKARTHVSRTWAAYSADGTVLESGDGAKDAFKAVMPSTATEGLMDWLCAELR